MVQKLIAIGDIHGEGEKLNKLLQKIDYTEDDYLIFLGDYVDRGSKNLLTSSLIRNIVSQHKNTILLRGNHEEMWIKAFDSYEQDDYFFYKNISLCDINGGDSLLKEFGTDKIEIVFNKEKESGLKKLKKEFSWFYDTQYYYETDDFIFVHAGTLPNLHPKDSKPMREYSGFNPVCWVREEFIDKEHNLGKKIVFGHSPQLGSTKPVDFGDKVCIDLGIAYENGLLCAMDVVSGKYWTV